jgi:hypothetical protein
MVNVAKTLYTMSPQSSIYCPIVDPPYPLPSYLSINLQSEWYTSALIASAVETATLPSRLRSYYDFESLLVGESGGTQRIYELQSSIIADKSIPTDRFSNSERRASWIDRKGEDETNINLTNDFDINFAFNDLPTKSSRLFNQVQIIRGLEAPKKNEDLSDEPGISRRLRLLNSEPIIEKFVITPCNSQRIH